jgi:hypothetical protein
MDKLNFIAQNIVQGDQKAVYELSLEEFQEVYRHVARLCQDQNKKIGETHILLLTENALIKFSISKIVIQINHKKNLSRKDFDVVISPKFEGNVKPITWRAFIWTELVHNWWILISVSLLFYFLFYANNNFSGISTINQLLIESNSLFISIFVLFTISQNRDLLTNKELVRKGLTHRLMQNDYYITSSAISSLVLAFISSSILTLPTNITISIPVINFSFFRATIAIALTHIALLILLDCFIAITNYYLKVMRTALESKMFVQLMDEHSEDENK